MARFFQQLRLLLWKNTLSVYRQPVWSLALIIWPLIIFIILAITRSKFPPITQNACYVAPRNLPSAGFFPFLQTLLCSNDSVCRNKSYEPVSPMNRMFGNSEESLRESLWPFRSLHLDSSQKGGLVRSALTEFSEKSQIVKIWDNIINSSQEDPLNFMWTIMNVVNSTVLTNQEVLLKDSVNILKNSLCTVVLSALNSSYQSSSNPFSFGLASFCNSSDTLLEAFLQTLNQVASNLLLTKPMVLLEAMGEAVLAFEYLQSDSLIWDALLGLPELFIPSSAGDKLQEVTMLLNSIKRTVNTIQRNVPQITIPVSMINMSIDAVTNILQYIQNSSSKGADVPLSDGFSMVNTESALIQTLLHAWNSEAASTGITFTTGLLNNLLQIYSWSVQNSTVNADSSSQLYGSQEEEKLLGVISTLKMLGGLPGWSPLNTFLTGSHISMDLAIQILNTLREQMDFLLSEARGIQQLFGPVLPNELQANTWLLGLPKAIVKTIVKGSLNCSDVISQWSSQSSLPSGDPLTWELVFCNRSYLPNTLLAQWMPLVERGNRFLELFQTPEEPGINVTTLLSDWKNLTSSYEQFSASLKQLDAMNEYNWTAWIPGNTTVNWLTMFLRNTNTFQMVGSEWQKNATWSMETYFYIVHWIMTFQPNITAPPNCTVERATGLPLCQSNFTWEEILPVTSSLMELCINPEALLRFVQGSVTFLDAVYGDFAMQSLDQLSSKMSPESRMQSLIKLLELYLNILSDIPSIEQLDSQPSLSIQEKVLDALGLKPLSLIWTQSFDNTSFIMDSVIQAFMNNSYMFSPFFLNLNKTSASLMELDNLTVQWLNLDGNLYRPLSFSISNTLLNHSALLNASHISYLQQILKHLNNDSERDVLKLVIKATEVLNQATETSHNASALILAYLWQVQNFLTSSLQINSNESFFVLDGLKNFSQMLDLHPAALDILQLNSTAFLQDPHQIGNISIIDTVLWQVIALLPEEFRYNNEELINHTYSLLRGLTLCTASSQDCTADVSEVFLFLGQAAKMLQQSENITNGLMTVNSHLTFERNLTFPLAVDLLALLSPLINSTNVSLTSEAKQRLLCFLHEIPPTLNISLSSLQYGLQMSNLSLEDLVFVAELAGSSTAQMVLTNLSGIIDAQGCFSLNNATLQIELVNSTEPHCLLKLIKETTGFFQDITINEDMKRLCMEMNQLTQFWQSQLGGSSNMTHFTYYDHLMSSSNDLSVILDKIHENLQDYGLESWNEVTTAIHVLKNIIQLFGNGTFPLPSINSTLSNQPEYVPEVYMDIALWYLRKLENISYTGDVSGLLYPLCRMMEMRLATSLAESQFITSIVLGAENLTQSIHIPLSESDLQDIENYVISVLYEELKLTKYVAELQMNFSLAMGYNTSDTDLQMFETEVEKYLHITEDFLKDTHLISIMAEILQQNASSPDLMNMDSIWLYDIGAFFPESQFHYLSIVRQVSQALKHALLIATEEDGVQNVNFTRALMEVFSIVIGNLSTDQWPLPDILTSDTIAVIYESLQLVFRPNMSYTEKVNLTLDILLKGESLIKVIAPNESLPILLRMTQALITYMETIIQLDGQDSWNQIFLQGSVAFLDAIYEVSAMQSMGQPPSDVSPESLLQSLITSLERNIKILSDISSIEQLDSQTSLSIQEKVLDALGLMPLSLIWTQSFDNTSFIMDSVIQAFMNNSYMFSPFFLNLNKTSASLMELDNLTVQWLNLDGNLYRPLCFSISNALLNHSALLNASHISYLQQILKHLNSDSERDVLKLVIKATEVLNQATETSHNASALILAYLWQVQNFLTSSLQINSNESFFVLDGLKNFSQMLDLHPAALDILQLNSTAFLQDPHQIGNISIIDTVLWQVIALLPEEFRYNNEELINHTFSLLRGLTLCTASSQDCAADVSEVFLFLGQAAKMLQQSENITNGLMTVNSHLTFERNLTFPLAVDLLALLSPLINSTNVSLTSEAKQRLLCFLHEIPPTLNISLASLQYGLQMSNLSLEDLVFVAELAGSSTAQMVLTNLSGIIDAQGCFNLNNATLQIELVNSTEPHCLLKLIKETTGFFQDITINEDMKRLCMEMNQLTQFWQSQLGGSSNLTHFTYYDHLMSSSNDLSVILDKIHENLQDYGLESWNEVTTAIHVLKNIIQLFGNGTFPLPSINSTLSNQPEYVPEVYMDIALWYLKKLENISYTGDVSGLLYPLCRMMEMQLATSLAESQFITSIVLGAENLTQSIHIPLSESDLQDIENYVISVLYEELKLTKYVAELQMNFSLAMGYNTSDTDLQMFETEVEKYLHITEDFLKDTHLISIMAEILQQNASSPDLMNMDSIWLYDIGAFFPETQFHYLSIVRQVSQALKHALLIATEEDGVQNVNFTRALMEVFSIVIGNLSTDQWPLPDILTSDTIAVIYESLQLVFRPNMSYTEKVNLTLDILLKGESLIKVIAPNESLPILLRMTQALITYMETIIQLDGQDNWNQIFLQGSVAFLDAIYEVSAMQSMGQPPSDVSPESLLQSLITSLERNIKILSDISSIEQLDSQTSLSIQEKVLDALGLMPLSLIWTQSFDNTSFIMDSVIQAFMNNSYMFSPFFLNLNKTSASLMELDNLTVQWLNLDGNLYRPLCFSISNALLNHSALLNASHISYLQQILKHLNSDSERDVLKLVIKATEVLNQATEISHNASALILAYLWQVQNFLTSSLQINSNESFFVLDGLKNFSQMLDLHPAALDILQLNSTAFLQDPHQIGNISIIDTVLWQVIALLPEEFRYNNEELINHTFSLLRGLTLCTASSQDCAADVSEVFLFLGQAAKMLQQSENITNGLMTVNSHLTFERNLTFPPAVDLLALLSPLINSTNVSLTSEAKQRLLCFLHEIPPTLNISLSSLQYGLQMSNLSLEDLVFVAELAGSSTAQMVLTNLSGIIDAQGCFSLNNATLQIELVNSTEPHCLLKLIKETTGFFQDITINEDMKRLCMEMNQLTQFWQSQLGGSSNMTHFTYYDHLMSSSNDLSVILDKIHENLQDYGLESWNEVTTAIHVLKNIIQLFGNGTFPLPSINSTLSNQPEYVPEVYMDIALWYLRKLENISYTGDVSGLLYPLCRMMEMQLATSLAESQFITSIVLGAENLTQSIHIPLSESDLQDIENYVISVLYEELKLTKYVAELQMNFSLAMGYNTSDTDLQMFETEVEKYLHITEDFLKDTHLISIMAEILQQNASSPDLMNMDSIWLYDIGAFFPESQFHYLSIVRQVSQALKHALLIATEEDGVQNVNFTRALMEVFSIVIGNLSTDQWPLPDILTSDTIAVIYESLQLVFRPNMSYTEKVNLTLDILLKGESLIKVIAPNESLPILLRMTQALITYMETIIQLDGQDNWNQIIIDQLQQFLPLNTPSGDVTEIIRAILDPSQGSLDEILQATDMNNLTEIFYKALEIGAVLFPGRQVLGLSESMPALLQIITGQADNSTWEWVEKMLEPLFSSEFSALENTPSNGLILRELVIAIAHGIRTETDLVYRLGELLANLTSSTVHTTNSSIFEAVLSTIELVQQATKDGLVFECADVLNMWEMAIQQEEISEPNLVMWCNTSLVPLIDSYVSNGSLFAHLNITKVTMAVDSLNITAADIATELHSLYGAILNHFDIIIQLLEDLSQPPSWPVVSNITGWNVSMDPFYMSNLLMPNAIKPLLEQATEEAPWMQQYFLALEVTLNYTLQHALRSMNVTITPDLINDVLQILMIGNNWTKDSIISFLHSATSENSSLADRLSIWLQITEDWPMINNLTKQYLTAEESRLLFEKMLNLTAWWRFCQTTGMEFVSEALMKIFDIVRPMLSAIIERNVDLPSYFDIYVKLIDDVLNMTKELNCHGPCKSHPFTYIVSFLEDLEGQLASGQTLSDLLPHAQVFRKRSKRDAETVFPEEILDLADVDYNDLLKVFSKLPSTSDIMQTIHMFFANSDLAVILKGVSREMTGDSSFEPAINRALDMLSSITAPGNWEMYAEMLMQITQQENVGSLLDMFLKSFLQPSFEIAQNSDNISSEMSAVIKGLIASSAWQEPQKNLTAFLVLLDQTAAAFASFMSAEQLMYFNLSTQLTKASTVLAYNPRNVEKVLQSASIISGSLSHLPTYPSEAHVLSGQSVQDILYKFILNSILVTQILENLTISNYTLGSMSEREHLVNEVFSQVVSTLPVDQRKYVLDLSPVVLSALNDLSSTAEIPHLFVNISTQVTASLLTILNLTEPAKPEESLHGGLASTLFAITELVSSTLWNGLMTDSSSVHLYDVFQSLNNMATSLASVLPPDASQYITESLFVLETEAINLNNSDMAGGNQWAFSAIMSSVEGLLAGLPYPVSSIPGINLSDQALTLERILQLFSLDQGFFGLNDTHWIEKNLHILNSTEDQILSHLLYPVLKNISTEFREALILIIKMEQMITGISWTNESFALQLDYILAKVCDLEQMGFVQKLLQGLSIPPGMLCKIGATVSNAIQMVRRGLVENNASFSDLLFETFIGDPNKYHISSNWMSYLSQSLGFDLSSLSLDNVTVTSQAPVKLSTFIINNTAFSMKLQNLTSISPEIIDLLMNSVVPNNSLQVLSWLTNMHYCSDPSVLALNKNELLIFQTFCSLTPREWYNFALVGVRYINVENIIFEFMLQSPLSFLIALLKSLMSMLNRLLPTIDSLVQNLLSVRDLNLMANSEFHDLVIGTRASISSHATFSTLSNALCTNGILSLFGISNLPIASSTGPSTQGDTEVEQLINKFNIPRDATPFCKNLFLDMVNTTAGAVAWAFLKPMLLGWVLYTPDIPLTRTIIQEANTTLQQFADLKLFSQEWLESSSYVMNSVNILQKNLPVLNNSLSNPFIQRFIQFETNIDVNQMKDTFNKFSNITTLLIQNKAIIQQISTLSSLMLNLSSCVRFDRFQGFNSSEELDALAVNLTHTRDLYASIIFKLPDVTASPSRQKRDSSGDPLPPKVKYTIRMTIDNVMRTDRTRNTYWVKDSYISPNKNQLYNRGFVYLQESIERAIIGMQTGTPVEEPAVQLQAFPYPCYIKDQYLNSMAFAFPLVLMIAWVLFVANFVKRLVHERELQLHEYMKMMGVNPISHFFAWFLESAVFLLVTIIILTIILKCGQVLPNSDGFLLFLYLCDYGLAILAISYLVSTFFDRTNIAGLSGSLIYIICFFPYIVIMSLETSFSFSGKSALSLFAPTCFSYASQYISRYEIQGEGIQWSNSYISPMDDDASSFGWFCWLLLIDSMLYFLIGIYIRFVFPGKYGIAVPWYFPVMPSFWMDLFGCNSGTKRGGRGMLFANFTHNNQAVFPEDKYKGGSGFTSQTEEEFSGLPVGVSLHGLTKMYGDRAAIQNLNVCFYEGHVTTLLGHNGAGKTTTMSLLTGLFGPSSGSIEVYGKDMQGSISEVRKELGVCMQYDVLFDHLSTKEHLLLYGQIKAPHWTRQELEEQVRKILQETGLYNHRHKRVGSLSGGMKRKLSISIAFIGGSRLVVLDEPTTGVDPCSRRNIWDIIIHQKKERTIILSTHHLDEAEVLSDRIAFLERGGLKCCGSPFYLKDKLAQGYNLTLTKKVQSNSKEKFDNKRVKAFVQSYIPEAHLKEGEVGDMVFMLPPFSSQNALAYRTLLSNLDSNLDALQLGCYGISDTTLEEVFLQLTKDNTQDDESSLHSASESVLDLSTIRDSMPEELSVSSYNVDDRQTLTGSPIVRGVALFGQRVAAMLLKRVHHSRRDWKGLFAQVLLPVLFVIAAMGLGSIKSDLQYFSELELSPALYSSNQQQYSFFSNQNSNSSSLVDTMLSFPGIDNTCLSNPADPSCVKTNMYWTNFGTTNGNTSNALQSCRCSKSAQVCSFAYQPPSKRIPSSQIIYNITGIDTENYLLTTANKYVRDRYGGWDFGQPLPTDLKLDINDVPQNRTLTKVWYNPEGYHTMPAYLNSLHNFILRSNLPSYKNPEQYEISVSSYPYPGQVLSEDVMVRSLVSTLVVLCILTGYSIMTASFAIYEVQEHQTGSKRLQHISGIGEPMYWTINFLYDMALYLIPAVLSIAVVAAFQLPAFTAGQNLGAVTLLLLLFGFATFSWMYLLSGIFKDAEMALITYICINLFISINTIISSSVVYFLWNFNNQTDQSVYAVYQILSYVFLIFPQFSFGNGLMDLARMDMQVQILAAYGVDAYQSPLGMGTLGWNFISLSLQGCIFFTLRLLLNTPFLRCIRGLISTKKSVPDASLNEDNDVMAESERVASGAASNDLLQINHLSKVYQHMRKKVHAVKKLSVGIPAGECFGLLGVNGAGKTTTFKMLTGDINPTDGTAQIRNWDGTMVDMIECYRRGIQIGYCPQVDALDDLLTAEEHLNFYACIRGIARREMDQEVNHLLRRLELNYHRRKTSASYSCGTRRKLSTAIALIGHPQILLLDEPSSGMDPRSKRHLWKVISEEVKGKCAVVLTSHSMEECEALCTRLAIMVNGQFRCLGSLQHIKHRFGSGFTVKMYLALASSNVESITNFMQLHFPSTYLKDQHSAMVEYHVPVAPGGVADIFDQLETNKIALQIKHFSVSQTTLDEVFINFALGKEGMETIPIHSEGSDADSLDSTENLEN